ncbi:MAG TPA: hypothetical protein VHG30_00115 [Microvirga sp.]|nr:hypothetical protein [Microvirga sp.]
MTNRTCDRDARSFLRSLAKAPTRREMLLFGIVLLACFWMLNGQRPRQKVFVVPDEVVRIGIVT